MFEHYSSCCFTVLHATLTDNHSKTYVAAPAWTNVTCDLSNLEFSNLI